jgi:pectin methylesterase-like acyl-CoA thioesterase
MLGFTLLLCLATDAGRLTVASDGSADFKTVQAAVDAAPSSGGVIYIRPGIYREKLVVNKAHIQLLPTAFYAEYKSSGEGANSARRQLSDAEARQFELTKFFDGWNAAEVH